MYINTGEEALAGRMSEARYLIYLHHPQVQRRQAGLVLCSGSQTWQPCRPLIIWDRKRLILSTAPRKLSWEYKCLCQGLASRNTEKKGRKKTGEV